MITYQQKEAFVTTLTPEGLDAATNGSPEARVWESLPSEGEGKTAQELQVRSFYLLLATRWGLRGRRTLRLKGHELEGQRLAT